MLAMIVAVKPMIRTACAPVEVRAYDRARNMKAGTKQVDVQLDQRADVPAGRGEIEQPAEAEEDQDRQENLSEDGPEQHGGKTRGGPQKQKNASG